MRTIMRFLLLTLVVAPIAYWLLGGLSLPSLSSGATVHSSLCERVDWHFAPTRTGQREWVATMEGMQDDPQVARWLRLTDAERVSFLAQCGKER